MNRRKQTIILVLTLITLSTIFSGVVAGQESESQSFEQPILLTSIGQSPGVTMAKVLAKRVDLEYISESTAKGEDLEDKDINTIVAVVGASGKGLGAAGLDIDEERSRVEELFQSAEELEIPIILMHIEGAQRRGDMSNQLINTFVPESDYLVVKKSGNDDGLFTELAEENEIPIQEVEETNKVAPILAELLG